MSLPPKEKARLGLRGRLLLVILPLVNLVFAGIWLISTVSARHGLTDLSRQNLALGSKNLSDALTRTLDDAYSDAVTTARLDLAAQAIDSGDPKNIAWYADEMVRTKRKYSAIVVADARGVIVGSSSLNRRGEKLPVALGGGKLGGLAWARQALRSEPGAGTFIPPGRPPALERALAPDERVMGFSLPVVDVMEERIGTVSLFVSVDFLAEMLDGYTELGSGMIESAAIVVDRDGRPVVLPSRVRASKAWQGARLRAGSGAASWVGPDERGYLSAGAAIGGTLQPLGWTLVTVKTKAALEAPIDAMTGRLLLAFVLAVLIVTAATVLFASRLVGPLERLTRATASAGRAADYTALPVVSRDEIGALTASFNRAFATIQDYEKGLEQKVAERTRELAEAKQEVSDILDNIGQGIVTVDAEGRINREFSAHTQRIFGDDVAIAGAPLLELLRITPSTGGETFARMDFWLHNLVGADELQWTLAESEPIRALSYARARPEAASPDDRRLELDYVPIVKDGVVTKIMVLIKDVTELSELHAEVERKDAENRANLERVAEIVSLDRDLFETFISESEVILARADEAILTLAGQPDAGAALEALFRAMHTLKGNARIFKITTVQDATHEVETVLSRLRSGEEAVTPETPNAIAERVRALRALISDFEKLGQRVLGFESGDQGDERVKASVRVPEARVVEVRRAFKELARALAAEQPDKAALARLREELAVAIQKLTQVPLIHLFGRLAKMTFDLAIELGKSIDDLRVEGGDVEVDTIVVSKMQDVLVHALRNAVDHGIEVPSVRLAAGKPQRGRVSVRTYRDGDQLAVDVSDDGAGVDFDAVRRKAVSERLIAEERVDTAGDDELCELLFRPGFSMARNVTKVSGRGVGMDVIASTMRDLGGTAALSTSKGRGTTLRLRVPPAYYQAL